MWGNCRNQQAFNAMNTSQAVNIIVQWLKIKIQLSKIIWPKVAGCVLLKPLPAQSPSFLPLLMPLKNKQNLFLLSVMLSFAKQTVTWSRRRSDAGGRFGWPGGYVDNRGTASMGVTRASIIRKPSKLITIKRLYSYIESGNLNWEHYGNKEIAQHQSV